MPSTPEPNPGPARVRQRFRVSLWLATRSLARPRIESQVRLVVGAITFGLILTFSALTPTALNAAQRNAAATPQGAPLAARDTGIRFEVIRDHYEGTAVSGLRLAAVGQREPTYEGTPVPGPGELLVSPAARELLANEADFAARYPGAVVGSVPGTYLVGPRSVVVWQGASADALAPEAGWLVENPRRNADLRSQVPQAIQLGYVVMVLGFILPLMALSAILAALGSRMRSDRASGLHLIGLPVGQLRFAASLEDSMLAVLSAALGAAAFFLLVPRIGPSLPFGDGIWPEDLSVDLYVAAALALAAIALGAVTAWRTVDFVHVKETADKSTVQSRIMKLGCVSLLAGGAAGTAVSQLSTTSSQTASILLLASIPATAVGFAGLLPRIVSVCVTPLLAGPPSAMWAARSIQSAPGRASRTSTGIVMLLTVAGLLMLFFPLISDLNATTEQRLVQLVGDDTIVTTGPDTRRSRERWRGFAPDLAAGAALRWYQPPGTGDSIFIADCAELESLSGIPVDQCRRGLTSRPDATDIVKGQAALIDGDSTTVVVPATVTYDHRVADITDHFANAGAVILPAPDTDLPAAAATVYLARARPGELERLRTRMTKTLVPSALTIGEQFRISTYTTRQFTHLLWFAIGVTLAIASLSTVIASFDLVRSTRSPRRLLAIAGARRSLFFRALQLQTMVPLLIAVPAASLISLTTSYAFVNLFRAEGGSAHVPLVPFSALAALCLVIPALVGGVLLRAESVKKLVQNPE